jgi:hypothetical protein
MIGYGSIKGFGSNDMSRFGTRWHAFLTIVGLNITFNNLPRARRVQWLDTRAIACHLRRLATATSGQAQQS